MPRSAQDFMYAVGGTGRGYYDVALRDFGLLLAAATLTRLALVYDRPRS
jgi:hypothetical protein